MTNLKDKLSASVRQAKAGQAPAAKPASAKPAPTKRAAPKKSVPQKPAVKPAARKIAPESDTGKAGSKPKVTHSSGAGEQASGVPNSGNALFPDRVWPD